MAQRANLTCLSACSVVIDFTSRPQHTVMLLAEHLLLAGLRPIDRFEVSVQNHYIAGLISKQKFPVLVLGYTLFLTSQNLQLLETCKLTEINTTEYKIRKAPTPDSLSTLEATVEALNLIEPQLDTSHAIKSFHKMIDLQIQKMGREVYLNNYLSKKKE